MYLGTDALDIRPNTEARFVGIGDIDGCRSMGDSGLEADLRRCSATRTADSGALRSAMRTLLPLVEWPLQMDGICAQFVH